jgi:hypothetical protein
LLCRYERKYFLSNETAELLKRRAAAVLRPDTHSNGHYWVHNLYLDDWHSTSYQEKQLNAFIRDKFRVRYYNNDFNYIRLEHKHKEGDLTFKQSVGITKKQYNALESGDMGFCLVMAGFPVWDALVNVYRTRGLRPTVSFSYLREAYFHETGNVRITFDSHITSGPDMRRGVMELKYSHFLPCFITDILKGIPLVCTEMSKYAIVMEGKRGRRYNGQFA